MAKGKRRKSKILETAEQIKKALKRAFAKKKKENTGGLG